MEPRAALIEKLQQHPELTYAAFPDGVRIESPAPSGFAVELHGDGDGWTVALGEGGFHEAFDTGEEALNFIAWCYSGSARLREVWRGASPARATLEAFEDGDWHLVAETRFLFVPFWRRRREAILTNPNLLKNDDAGDGGPSPTA